jgi:adenylate cyclase
MHKTAAIILVGLAAAVIVLGAHALGEGTAAATGLNPLETVELKTYDWRLRQTARPETARQDIALVRISEEALRKLEPVAGRWPWPRLVHAELIDYLARGPAAAIAYDVNFAGPDTRVGFPYGAETLSGAESDRMLVESMLAAGTVIALADATFEGNPADAPPVPDSGFRLGGEGVVERHVIYAPFDGGEAAASLGHNLFILDPDGPIRHTIPFVRSGDRAMPSLGLAAAFQVAGIAPSDIRLEGDRLHMADRVMPLSWRQVQTPDGPQSYLRGLINFRGSALVDVGSQTYVYPTYDFYDLLYSEEQLRAEQAPMIDPSIFRDRIVFVGTTGSSLFDVFETPFSHGRMPGINIHAAVADDFLSNRFMRRADDTLRVASVLAAGLLVAIVATLLPAWWAALVVVLLVSSFGWIATRAFADGYWINVVEPVLTASVALLGGVGYQYFVEGREKRKMKRLFGQYVSKDVYEQLVANPALARLGGTRRDMTVLFSDIRGFTTVTERGQPEEIVGMLNEYFTQMVDIVFRHEGTLDKFVGDMVMALFGAPLDDPRHADHAVEAALEMIDELGKLNEGWKAQGRFADLDIGIGINTGPMIAGNIGSQAIMSYTVIGDAVNLGARLESLNKQHGTRIIISDSTRLALTGRYIVRPLGDVVVKGKSESVAIFEVIGRAVQADAAPAHERAGERTPGLEEEAPV